MKIQILGTGCPKCNKLAQQTENAAKDLGLEYELEKVTDINQIMSYGIMMTPMIVVGDEVVGSGRVIPADRLAAVIEQKLGG